MTLRVRRSLPLVILLTALLALCATGLGNTRIVAYHFLTETIQSRAARVLDLTAFGSLTFNLGTQQ